MAMTFIQQETVTCEFLMKKEILTYVKHFSINNMNKMFTSSS